MMHAAHTYTSQFPMYQSQKLDKDVLYLQNLQGQNISTDNLYTSVELLKWLLTRNITTVGTVQKGRHGIIYCYYKAKREKECRDSFDNEANGCLYQR